MRDSGWMGNASTPVLGSSASSKRIRNERGGTRGGDISSLPGICEVSVRCLSESGAHDERSIDDDGPRTVSNSQVLSRTPVCMLGRLCQVYQILYIPIIVLSRVFIEQALSDATSAGPSIIL
jgi:hypothetical protein